MIGWMVAHQVDAASVAVVSFEFGRVAVRQRAKLEKRARAGAGAERFELPRRPGRALAFHRLLQRRVGIVKIEVGQLDRLVEHFVRCGAIGVERAAEIVLSVGQGAHGVQFPFCERLHRHGE